MSQSRNCKQNTNILIESELTCGWVVVVLTTINFVAFANRAEGAILAGQEYRIFVTVPSPLPFFVFGNGAFFRAGTVSQC